MMHYFSFNGKDSRDFNLYITSKNVYDKPERDVTFVPVSGRSGDLIIDNGKYNNLELRLGLRLFVNNYGEPDDVAFCRCYDRVSEWLSQMASYSVYTDSYNPTYYRMACVSGGLTVNQLRKDVADLKLRLNCKPHKFSFEGNETISCANMGTGDSFVVTNPENEIALPIIRIYTSFPYDPEEDDTINNTFMVRNSAGVCESYTVTNIVDSCIIDSEMMNVYAGTVNKNGNYLNDTFPVLYPGKNTIYSVTNVTRIDVVPRWRAI